MKWAAIATILLVLEFVNFSESRPFTDEEKEMLRKEGVKWKAPDIDEFLEDNVSKKGTVYTYRFQYKNTKESKHCFVTYKEKKKVYGMMEVQIKWQCKTTLPEDDPDYQGDDYIMRRRRRHNRKKKRKNVW